MYYLCVTYLFVIGRLRKILEYSDSYIFKIKKINVTFLIDVYNSITSFCHPF